MKSGMAIFTRSTKASRELCSNANPDNVLLVATHTLASASQKNFISHLMLSITILPETKINHALKNRA